MKSDLSNYMFLQWGQHGIDTQWMVSCSRHKNETNISSVKNNV